MAGSESGGGHEPIPRRNRSCPTAVALLSGGLDSTLAAKVVSDLGVEVIGINFAGAYCPLPLEGLSKAQQAAGNIGIELITLPINEEFIAMVKDPKHGRGKNMNPCIDCHTLMIQKAWELGRSRGAAFVVTGEVLGQRPMSQNRKSLDRVAEESGVPDRLLGAHFHPSITNDLEIIYNLELLRPLSAKLLEPTRPELDGLVYRERLHDIQGRNRQRQFELAKQLGITDYPQPAGGCLLTEIIFSKRLREAFDRGEDSLATVELLRVGRHFRFGSGSRFVIGRNKSENALLMAGLPENAALIDATALPGPLGILVPDSGAEERELGARIAVAFSDKRAAAGAAVRITPAVGMGHDPKSQAGFGSCPDANHAPPDETVTVTALDADEIKRLSIA